MSDPQASGLCAPRAQTSAKGCRGGNGTNSQQKPVWESVLALLVEEVKELKNCAKQMNSEQQEMRCQVRLLHDKQKQQEKQQQDVDAKLNDLMRLVRSHDSPKYPSPVQRTPSVPSRKEILDFLPFLIEYDVPNGSTAFVLDDLRKPFIVMKTIGNITGTFLVSAPVEDTIRHLPVIAFVNDTFCKLVGYSKVNLFRLCIHKTIILLIRPHLFSVHCTSFTNRKSLWGTKLTKYRSLRTE